MGYIKAAYADQYRRGHTALGTHPDTGDTLYISDIDRQSSMYVPGKAGMGKSSFLETIAAQDIAKGNALIFVDPHGDSVRNIIAQTPQQYMNRIFLLDLEDEDFPFGVNLFADALFETGMDRSKALARVTNIFNVLWPETKDQAYLPIHLNAAIVTLLSNPGSTLVDMRRLFDPAETAFRQRLLKNVTAQDVHEHWHRYETGGKTVVNEAAALVRRLTLLFMGRDLVKNIVGQRKTSIDFRKAIEERKIILIKLPVNEATGDAKLIGTFLMSQLTFALFSFGDTEKSQRPGVTIIIDECQNFTTPDFERLITQGRKFGARLVLAHQFRDQLPPFLQKATMGSRTIVVFRTNLDDASELAPLFHTGEKTLEPENISRDAVRELRHMGSDLPYEVQVFVDTYLRGLKSSGDILAKNAGYTSFDIVMNGTRGHGIKPREIPLPNPTDALDDLFRQVMQTGNPHIPIPVHAVMGLANGGIGFFSTNWFERPTDRWLTAPLDQFPRHLVQLTQSGWRWMRKPESKSDQFIHCVFHLRMAMAYLATYPIGKVTAGKKDDVTRMLSHLRERHAFVQTSDGVWYMKTDDTPPAVSGEALQARLFFVQQQTRQTYCHPRIDVERANAPTAEVYVEDQPTVVLTPQKPDSVAPGHSRWEDI